MKSYDNIKAIILDKDGVFVDFHQLWMRIIAARAQILAEYTTAKWEDFNYVRTMCIRAMGVDEEDDLSMLIHQSACPQIWSEWQLPLVCTSQ